MNASKAKRKTNHHCAFHGCTNNSRFTPPEIKFHPFVKPCLKISKGQEEVTQSHLKQCPTCMKCNRWVMVGQGTKKWPKSLTEIKPSHYLCSLHFVHGHPYSDQFPDPLSATGVLALRNKRKALQENVNAAKRRNVLLEGVQSEIPKSSDSANCPSETVDVSYNCLKCSHQTASMFQLNHHIDRKHNQVYAAELFHAVVEPEEFSCSSCDYKSYYLCELYEHFVQTHDPRVETNDSGSFCGKIDLYSCDNCRRYQSHTSLSLAKHHELCEEEVQPNRTQDSTKDHNMKKLKYVKSNTRGSSEGAGRFKCNHCSYRTRYKANLKRHMLRHAASEEINWFRCTHCSYQAKQKSYLRRHMQRHATDEEIYWFQCNHCSFQAKQKSSLQTHMLQHATDVEIDWFQCNKCSYRAKQNSHLRTHMLQHATDVEIDWFQCNKCSYRGKRKSHLKSHMLKHARNDEINWLQCTNCSYRAKQKSTLRTHMLQHAADVEIDWFQCKHCSYRAKRKAHLQTHMVKHANE